MSFKIKNLVFEGGGVKGIAYIGAMQALDENGLLKGVKRVAGTSAGAINACLFALDYSIKEQQKILEDLDFNKFEDTAFSMEFKGLTIREKLSTGSWWATWLGRAGTVWLTKGLNPGNYFYTWIGNLIHAKTGKKEATFLEVFNTTGIELHVCVANMSTGLSEVFSHIDTPNFEVAKAVRMSMSIPLFFAPVEYSSETGEKLTYVDGGIFRNFPIRLFDNKAFADDLNNTKETEYYSVANEHIGNDKKLICNYETLGFRLDSLAEIETYRDKIKPKPKDVSDTVDFFKAVLSSLLTVQENQHLNSDDWARTVYIDTLGTGTTDFDISNEKKALLIKSGRDAVVSHLSQQETPHINPPPRELN